MTRRIPALPARTVASFVVRRFGIPCATVAVATAIIAHHAGAATGAEPADRSGVVLAVPGDNATGSGVVPAGGVHQRVTKGDSCERADCPQCQARKHSRHHSGGPEIPGCPAHCPVRPDRFGYYQTNWRRWPGNAVKPASFEEQAVPISPPKSVVPGIDEEGGAADEAMEEEGGEADTLPEPNAAAPRSGAAEPEKSAAPAEPVPPVTPAPVVEKEEPSAPKPPKPKAADDLFEPSSSAPSKPSSTLAQWRARRRPAPAAPRLPVEAEAGTDGTRLATAVEPVAGPATANGAANEPAEVDPGTPRSKPIRVAAPLRR